MKRLRCVRVCSLLCVCHTHVLTVISRVGFARACENAMSAGVTYATECVNHVDVARACECVLYPTPT